jgi:hypothetical protein
MPRCLDLALPIGAPTLGLSSIADLYVDETEEERMRYEGKEGRKRMGCVQWRKKRRKRKE